MSDRMPVLAYSRSLLLAAGHACPESWPFEPFASALEEMWRQRNHQQTAETLARRGGLAPAEALAVLENRYYLPADGDDIPAVPAVAALIIKRGYAL